MKSFPWDAIAVSKGDDGFPIYDRSYTAEDLQKVYATFFSNGVFLDTEDAFAVLADESDYGMYVTVQSGKCCIEGTIGWETNMRTMALQAPSDQDRIDTVILRRNANKEERKIDIYVKQGTPAEIPQAPSLTRNESVYELGLADVFVSKNDEAVSQQRISDTRLDDGRCGMVTPLLDIDTTTFFAQLQDAITNNVATLEAQTNAAVELANAALAGTIPGQLQEQINTINADGWVTTERIADMAITTDKVANGAIGTNEIADNAITTDKVLDAAVDYNKISRKAICSGYGSITIPLGSNKYGDATITLPEEMDRTPLVVVTPQLTTEWVDKFSRMAFFVTDRTPKQFKVRAMLGGDWTSGGTSYGFNWIATTIY